MSKQTKKTIFGILGGIALMLVVGYLPPETEMMTRQAWQHLGCFGFLLVCLISGALPDWVATLATMVWLLVFKIGTVATVTAQFSGTTVWLCIGVFIMFVGINNSGFMKRLALWVLTKFPGTYRGQVTAMMLRRDPQLLRECSRARRRTPGAQHFRSYLGRLRSRAQSLIQSSRVCKNPPRSQRSRGIRHFS